MKQKPTPTTSFNSTSLSVNWQARLWLGLCAVAALAVIWLFPDSAQHDGGIHYLFARWAWQHHELFVDVWSRPLFTVLYAFPALLEPATLGFAVARALTVLICLLTAQQTWRHAAELQLPRAPLVIALLFIQPSFFLFCADTMTEPLFALVFIIALRLFQHERHQASAFVASLLILIRPEGLFTTLLWAYWIVRHLSVASRQSSVGNRQTDVLTSASDTSVQPTALGPLHWSIRNPQSATRNLLPLGFGFLLWWLASWLITGDVLFIKHNWPANWPFSGTIYGAPGIFNYPARLPEIVGALVLPAFLFGLYHLRRQRQLPLVTEAWLTLFIIHTIMRTFGLMGSAGYPRYLITVAPAAALITLTGWNISAARFSERSRALRLACATAILALSFGLNFLYVDGAEWMRDAHLVTQTHTWWQVHPRPIKRLIWSQPYMCLLLGGDPWQNEFFTQDPVKNRALLQAMPAGTLVFWDLKSGPRWTDVKIEDFQANGFTLLHEQRATLSGYWIWRSFFGVGGPRQQRMALLYKE